MTPKIGEVYMVNFGAAGKFRPAAIVSREDDSAPPRLSTMVPLTTANIGSRYEVPMPRVPWLKAQGWANVQAIACVEHHELSERRGRFDPSVMAKIKEALRWALDLQDALVQP